jgi:hypothetical protein
LQQYRRKADLWTATYDEYNLDTPVGPLFCIASEATTLGKVGEVAGVILDTGEVLRCEPDTHAVRSIPVGSGPLVRLPLGLFAPFRMYPGF